MSSHSLSEGAGEAESTSCIVGMVTMVNPRARSQLPAPWRAAFLASAPQTFVFSTVQAQRHEPSRETQPASQPRARTCVLRGLWCHLPRNERNPARLNPAGVWASDMPAFTTDARMAKVQELWASSSSRASLAEEATRAGILHSPRVSQRPTVLEAGREAVEDVPAAVQATPAQLAAGDLLPSSKPPQSFVGGPVEAVFWSGSPAQTQWRVRGRAVVVGPDIESASDSGPGLESGSSGVVSARARDGAKALLLSRMRPFADTDADLGNLGAQSQGTVRDDQEEPLVAVTEVPEEDDKWSFARELTAHFGNLSPLMRGTFRNPPPGTPMHQDEGGGGGNPEHRLGQRVWDLHDAEARRNFRVVVIVPDELDQVDLRDPERARRWLWRRCASADACKEGNDGADEEWKRVELWP